MPKQALTNLHKNMGGMNNDLVKNFRSKLSEFGNQVRESLPSLLGHVDVSSHGSKLNKLKKKFLKKLDGKRKKFRLALESLGWGTLADLLDHAFNGDELNVIV